MKNDERPEPHAAGPAGISRCPSGQLFPVPPRWPRPGLAGRVAVADRPGGRRAAPAKAAEARRQPALPGAEAGGAVANVHSVTLVGRWSDRRESGVYRVIVVKGGNDELATPGRRSGSA